MGAGRPHRTSEDRRVDGNGGGDPNYQPNSFDDITIDATAKEPAWDLGSSIADWYDRNAEGENDHFTRPGNLFRLMTDGEKKNTIGNIVGALQGVEGPKKSEIINPQICHFFRAGVNLGMAVTKGLGVNLDALPKEVLEHQHHGVPTSTR